MQAEAYVTHPASTTVVYSYFRGVDLDGIELYSRPGRFFVATPTNDDLTFVAVQVPVAEAPRFQHVVEEAFFETLLEVPHLAARVHRTERAERFRFARLPDSFLRQCAGPGWALVGDAGCHKDPITAQGMHDAFRDAERLAEAIDAGLGCDLDVELPSTRPTATPPSSRCSR